ncbi:MAG: ROK family protein [Chloroflexia bacterium]|nr:ROK family protein [Chloroflexia bacterium]
MTERTWILGFDIGGTKTAAVAGTATGETFDRGAFASRPERGFEPMWHDIVEAGKGLVARHGQPEAIGVSIGGPLHHARGVILSPPNLPGWDDISCRSLLEDVFGVPVYVEHDAKTGALAEWLFGAAQGRRNVIFLTFGTGLGAGLILDGRLYRGASDNAGDVGHWRIADDGPLVYGKRGSWEGFSSGTGLAALARERHPDRFDTGATAQEVIERARTGDAAARQVVEVSATYLGRGIALLVDLLNPDIVVLGSLAVRAGDLFLPTVRRIVAEEAQAINAGACELVPSALGDRIGDVAALCAAIYHGDLTP